MPRKITDDLLDKMDAIYREEYARWTWRRRPQPSRSNFELVRFDRPAAEFIGVEPMNSKWAETRIESLTNYECRDRHEAAGWMRTFAGRAAMMASLGILK